jgi:hypothetical protein
VIFDDNVLTHQRLQGSKRRSLGARLAEHLGCQQFGAARANQSDLTTTFARRYDNFRGHIQLLRVREVLVAQE